MKYIIYGLLQFTLLITACKKEENDNNDTLTCLLSTYSYNSLLGNFSYNEVLQTFVDSTNKGVISWKASDTEIEFTLSSGSSNFESFEVFLNSEGKPIKTIINSMITSDANYNSAGQLESIIYRDPSNMTNGGSINDPLLVTIDSFQYDINGNILAHRFKADYTGSQTRIRNNEFVYEYSSKIYNGNFNPIDFLFALTGRPLEFGWLDQNFHIQYFSNNLLVKRTIRDEFSNSQDQIITFEYIVDEKGDITAIDEDYVTSGGSNQWTFNYSCK